MSYQDYFNILLGLVAFLGGWWMKAIWSAIQKLEATDQQTLAKVSSIEVLIAGNYARKTEVESAMSKIVDRVIKVESLEVLIANHYVMKTDFSHTIDALFRKLDRIEEKIDSKADKPK